jgi:ribosome biogenesis SPOUT family RNA methylase Rps3
MAVAGWAVAETRPDRTSELRKKGYEGRRLGPKQMTTDTAVRVTRLVVQEKSKLLKQMFVHLY